MLLVKIFFRDRKYFSSAFLFFCFSTIFSTWVTYIPYVADKIGITEGKIGGAIFFASLGSFLMIPIANFLVDRVGVGRLTYFALLVYSTSIFGPILASNYISLCVSLFLFGMMSSCFAIALNSLTATIEKQDKVYILSGSHGFWSIGGVIGAGSGSFLAAFVNNPLMHVSSVVLLIIGIQTYLRSDYYYRKGDHHPGRKFNINYVKPLIIIALLGLIFMVAEGSIADWGALYLKKVVRLPLPFIGTGYAIFSLAMVLGRFSGDFLSLRFGSWQLLIYTSLLSVVGFGLVLVIHPVVSLIGFFIVGLGFSVVVPEVYRLASNVEGVKTSDGVSIIAASTNIGFLVGPVFLGFLAEVKTLHTSFIVLTAFVSIAFIISVWKYKS